MSGERWDARLRPTQNGSAYSLLVSDLGFRDVRLKVRFLTTSQLSC
jgi:hypothetical protein